MIHGDPIISGVQEERQDSRPKCGFKVTEKIEGGGERQRDCGSEERVYHVTGHGKYTSRKRETDVCERHLPHAIKQWNWDTAVPIDTVSKARANWQYILDFYVARLTAQKNSRELCGNG